MLTFAGLPSSPSDAHNWRNSLYQIITKQYVVTWMWRGWGCSDFLIGSGSGLGGFGSLRGAESHADLETLEPISVNIILIDK